MLPTIFSSPFVLTLWFGLQLGDTTTTEPLCLAVLGDAHHHHLPFVRPLTDRDPPNLI